MLIIFHINYQNTNIQPNRRHTGEYYPQRLILHKFTFHNPDRMKKKPTSARGRPKRLPTYRLRKDGTCGTSSDSHAGSLPKRPSDGPATLDLGGGIERHVAVCFAAAYDRHHPLPIQATPLPEKIPVHATKRNFRASIIENNRNRHDLWAKRLSSPCLQGCSCCTHPRRRRRTRKVPRRKLHDRDGRIRRRRQIPGKRISSVLLYGRLHFRQALVSRSRLLVRHLLSGRRRRQTNHPAAFRPDAIRFPNLTHHPLLSTRPRHTDFFRRSYRLPFPRLHGPPHHVRTAYLVLLPSGSGRVVPPAKTPGPSSRPRRHDKPRVFQQGIQHRRPARARILRTDRLALLYRRLHLLTAPEKRSA